MRETASQTNPYRMPAIGNAESRRIAARPSSPPIAQLVSKSLLYRRIHVEAPIEAMIEYSGLGLYDRVWVNGRLVAKRLPLVWLTDLFEFELETDVGQVPVELRLLFSRFARLSDVQLYVAGQLVYQESHPRAK